MRSAKIPPMRCGLLLALVAAMPLQQAPAGAELALEIRTFDGADEVTPHTRLTVHRAGDRTESLPLNRVGDGRVRLRVPQGIYDVQAIHERDGRVVNIRWANRLVVMPYPDEGGQHLEVINFKNGFGALQVTGLDGTVSSAAIFDQGKRTKPAAAPAAGAGYILFVVPAGTYDLQIRTGSQVTWTTGIDVPLDRTRLTVIQP
jgi:hypothetical protein